MEISPKSQYKNATNIIQTTFGKEKSAILPEVNSKLTESKLQLPLAFFFIATLWDILILTYAMMFLDTDAVSPETF